MGFPSPEFNILYLPCVVSCLLFGGNSEYRLLADSVSDCMGAMYDSARSAGRSNVYVLRVYNL